MKTAAKPIKKIDKGFISKSMFALCVMSNTPTTMRTKAAKSIRQENSSLLLTQPPQPTFPPRRNNACEFEIQLWQTLNPHLNG